MKVIATLSVDKERLLSAYKDRYEEGVSYDFAEALNIEFGWLEESGIKMIDWKVEKGEC